MDYALLAATALGAIGLYLMLPRERAPLARLGFLVGAMALAGLFLVLVRAGGENVVNARTMPPVYFYLFAAIMIGGAVGVVSQPKPVYAALYFVLVTLAGAGLFVLLMAEFMAVVLIIIYAGAILVTYVFVIMLASQGSPQSTLGEPGGGGGGGGGLAAGYDRRATSGCTAVVLAFLLVGATLNALLPGAPSILSASWGVPGRSNDVTAKLKDLVAESDGRLELNVNSQTLGGNFPANPTEQPELVVSYAVRGVRKNMTVKNGETLAIGKTIAKSRAATPDPLMAANLGVMPLVAAPAQPATSQPNATTAPTTPLTPSNVQVLGVSLYSHYSFSLELAGILLTIALIGAVIIARKNTALEQPLGTGKLPAE